MGANVTVEEDASEDIDAVEESVESNDAGEQSVILLVKQVSYNQVTI